MQLRINRDMAIFACMFVLIAAPIGFAQGSRLKANGLIAFTSDRNGNQEIYVMAKDGSRQRRLTNNPGVDSFPTWSPDGKKIAFVSQDITSGNFYIKIMGADGSNQTPITSIAFDNTPYPWHYNWSLSWSPDSRKIAFQDLGEIYSINADGTGRTNLTNNPADDSEPSWSPDGVHILFASSRVPWIVMHMMNADGSNVQQLPSDGEFWDTSPVWSPAGNKIAFIVSSDLALPIIYTANADGTNRQVFDGGESGGNHRNKPKWSPDGTKIVFHIWEYFSNHCEIFVKDLSTDSVRQLTNTSGNNFQPSWQPIPPASASDD